MSKKKKSRKQLLDEIAAVHARFGEEKNVVTPILYLALDGTLLSINEIGARNLGGIPDDFIGKKISEIVPDMAQTAIERIFRATESGTGGIFEDLVELPSGKRWFLTDSNVVKNTSGEAIAFEVVSMDVTEWKIAEQKAGLLTKVVEQSSEGIAVANMDGYLLFINEAFAAMHGYRPEELLGKHLSIFHSPEQMPAVKVILKQLRETGEFEGEIWHARRDGSVFPSLMHNTVLHDESGGEIGIIGTLRDITDYKRTSEELEKSEQNYRNIFNAVNDAIFIHDMETGRILDANEKTCEMFGYTIEELCTLDVGAISSGEKSYTQKDASKWIRKTAEESPQVFEWQSKNKQSNLFWVEVTLKRVTFGTTDRVLAVVRDITERKKAAEALRQSEQDKALILGSLSELISYQDKSLKIVWANEAAGDSVGQSADELVGRYCYEVWHGRQEPCRDCPVAKSIESGQPQEGETTSPDGRIWHIRGCPVLNEQGDVVGAVEATLDITRRKQATEELQKLATVVRYSSELVNLATLGGKMIFLNEAGSKMLGIEPDEVEQVNIMQVIPDHLKQLVETELLPTLKDLRTWEGELQYRNLKTGELTDVHAITFAVQDPLTSEPLYLANVSRDITERKRTENALQASEQKHKAMVENIPGMVYRAHLDWSAEIISGSKEICGYTPDELNSREGHWLGVIHPDDKEGVFEEGAGLIKEQKSIVQVYRIIAKSGENHWVEDHKTSLFSQEGQFIGIDGIVFDITDRKRIEQNLAAHHEKMQRAEQLASLGTVSATVAHELNQPLTVMRLFLQQGLRALKDDNDGDKVAEVIDDCLSELTKAASIVDRFRRFARKSAPVYIAKVNLVEIANGIVEILAESARREKLNLSVTVESCPPYIIGNSFELEQMFFVLIQNTIQAADGKTERELAISISSQGDQVHLTFADTCSGIRKEDIDKIFEPFFTTKPANLGTGLGLCILERIVKRHGGSVRVESRVGRGTIFYICLPIKS